MIFRNREQAGQLLADQLRKWEIKEPIVIALPRGGVPVAAQIAAALQAPLDVLVVRKIGAPENPEYGVGAISEDGSHWLNETVIQHLNISKYEINKTIHQEFKEVQRRINLYRQGRPLKSVQGKTVILVDDGLATGVTATIGCLFLKKLGAARIIFTAPTCAPDSASSLRSQVEEVFCLQEPEHFFSVGQWYEDFSQLSDEEVSTFLSEFELAEFNRSENTLGISEEVEIGDGGIRLPGHLTIPPNCSGIVLFAHGSGSSRSSPRNIQVANALNQAGLGTLLFDLLMPYEASDRSNVFDIPLLASRLVLATSWLKNQKLSGNYLLGYFGASTGAGAALWAAAELGHEIAAIVSRGGRPDLAFPRLEQVTAPVLLIVGGEDEMVIQLNQEALEELTSGEMVIIPGATHLFEEPGALEAVALHAQKWFIQHFRDHQQSVTHRAA